MPLPFHAWKTEYKSRFGAVPAETPVFFRILVPRSEQCSAACFVIRPDSGEEMRLAMFWAGMAGDFFEWWDVTFTPGCPGLYWYHFELETSVGRKSILLTENGEGSFSGSRLFQQTVYEPGFETPDWLCGGLIYQIFPDRFRRSGQPKGDVPEGRVLREDWGSQPLFRPVDGKIRNNDFFGGDLEGIREKLDYLASLHVTCLYLNPVFEAHSNHRYDTADYRKIDPLLGTREDFSRLCREAAARGIRVVLDGVFSHTGSDSVYFNKEGRYPSEGAYLSKQSPYYHWYRFRRWPDDYACWWDVPTLPEVDKESPDYIEFITGKNGVLETWQEAGAGGWRLDVADELPDVFLDALRESVKKTDPEALILGEVWEDASHKISYGRRRRYLLGRQLDSVMNYPFCNAVTGFVRGGGAEELLRAVMQILENYPPQVTRLLMNHLGTHDTERLLTRLGGEPSAGRGREWQSGQALSPEQRAHGKRLLKLASALQYTLPGVPSLYYGDEAGLEGYGDPFNRACYPWGKEDRELLQWYRALGAVRAGCSALREGDFLPLRAQGGFFCFMRRDETSALACAVNRSEESQTVRLPEGWEKARLPLGGALGENGLLTVPSCSAVIALR